MSPFYLGLAIVLEVAGTLCLKASNSFTNLRPSIGVVVFYAFSFVALALALKKIDVSVAYAVWSGVGMALISVAGVFLFRETMTFWKVASIALIIIGVVGLRLSSGSH